MSILLIVAICVTLGVLGQIFMKKGVGELGIISIKDILSSRLFSIVFQKYVFLGICFYFIGNLLWLVVLSIAELSYVYPLGGTGYILTAILAWIFFGERITPMRVIGIILISVGACFVVLKI